MSSTGCLPGTGRVSALLERLDGLGGVRFVATLYVVRWLVLLPLLGVLLAAGPSAAAVQAAGRHADTGLGLRAFQLLVGAPGGETLVECFAPYLVLRLLLSRRPEAYWRRPRTFVVVSALAMVAAHPLHWTIIGPAFVTGAFLAYTYAHFAPRSHGLAFLATTLFHSAINLVGFTLLAWERAGG